MSPPPPPQKKTPTKYAISLIYFSFRELVTSMRRSLGKDKVFVIQTSSVGKNIDLFYLLYTFHECITHYACMASIV